MGQDYSGMKSTNTIMHNTHVFDNIGKNMNRIVDTLTKARTLRMKRILVTRKELSGGNGRFPRSEKPRLSGHSYKYWTWKKRGPRRYALLNDHRADDGYPYVRNLITGKHWSGIVLKGNWKRLKNGPNGGVFSTQMPNGMNPWFVNQREKLKKDIKRAVAGKKLKDYR
jgi:hypothetical protein